MKQDRYLCLSITCRMVGVWGLNTLILEVRKLVSQFPQHVKEVLVFSSYSFTSAKLGYFPVPKTSVWE